MNGTCTFCMFQSHASYSAGTDRLVALAREAGAAVAAIAERYAQDTGRTARVFSGSSPGAAAFGVLRLAGV